MHQGGQNDFPPLGGGGGRGNENQGRGGRGRGNPDQGRGGYGRGGPDMGQRGRGNRGRGGDQIQGGRGWGGRGSGDQGGRGGDQGGRGRGGDQGARGRGGDQGFRGRGGDQEFRGNRGLGGRGGDQEYRGRGGDQGGRGQRGWGGRGSDQEFRGRGGDQGFRGRGGDQGGRGQRGWGGRGGDDRQGGRGRGGDQGFGGRGRGGDERQGGRGRGGDQGFGGRGGDASGQPDRSGLANRSNMRGRTHLTGDFVYTRPAHCSEKRGANGAPITVVANHYPVVPKVNFELRQYTVNKEPEALDTFTARRILDSHRSDLGNKYIFDGTSLFQIEKLKVTEIEGTHKGPGGDIKYKFNFSENKHKKEFYSPEFYQLLNLLFRRTQAQMQMRQLGKNFFNVATMQRQQVCGKEIQIYEGMISSIRCHEQNEFQLNIDPIVKVMPGDSLWSIAQDSRGDYSQFLHKVVCTPHAKHRTYKVLEISESKVPSDTFSCKGNMVSFADYARKQYNLNTKDMRQPLLRVRPSAKGRNFTEEIYLIPEHCILTGIDPQERKRNGRFNMDLMKLSRRTPGEKMRLLNNMHQNLARCKEAQTELANWNVEISNTPISLGARVLAYPTIFGEQSTPYRGAAIRDKPRMSKWVIIGRTQEVSQCLESLSRAMDRYRWPEPTLLHVNRDDNPTQYIRILEGQNFETIDMVIAIIRDSAYSEIKQYLACKAGVQSQCILSSRFRAAHKLQSIIDKVIVQIACKLGGNAWILSSGIPKETMIVGFDACHEQRDCSYGAIVCSYNDEATQYFSRVKKYYDYTEVNHHLAPAICEGLEYYKEKNGQYPKRVIVYRDGVGEGQLAHVHQEETTAIKKKLMEYAVEIKLLFVVVTKRINTKFFLPQGNGYGNVRGGTVVDSIVTLPERYDFYLVSQSTTQGTCCPTSFNVIYDDLNVTPDRIQGLSYLLTYLYFNWAGNVSVPSPCMYAHKLAYMAGAIRSTLISPKLKGTLWFL